MEGLCDCTRNSGGPTRHRNVVVKVEPRASQGQDLHGIEGREIGNNRAIRPGGATWTVRNLGVKRVGTHPMMPRESLVAEGRMNRGRSVNCSGSRHPKAW